MTKLKWLTAFSIFVTVSVVLASSGGGYKLSPWLVANGGSISSASGYLMNGSIGQPVVGQSSGSGYIVNSGFWGSYYDLHITPSLTPIPSTETFTPMPITETFTPVAVTVTNTPEFTTPTSTPDILTMTTTPEPQGSELIINGGFEIDSAAPLKQPDNWTLTGKSLDKLKCNTTPPVSFEGICAYLFKGVAGENAKLSQKLDTTLPAFTTNDTLMMSVQYKTGASTPKLKVKVRVFYTNTAFTTGKMNQTINMQSNTGYTLLVVSPYTLIDANVSRIKVQFQNKATNGKIYIDAASLMLNP